MVDLMSTPPYSLVPSPQNQSWLDQHPHWKILVGGLIVLGLLLLLVGAAVFGTMASVRSSSPYQEAISRLYASPQVIEALGEPLQTGFIFFGSYQGHGYSGEEDFKLRVSGPKGRGALYVCASRNNNRWRTDIMRFSVDGSSEAVDLLRPAGVQPAR
jgi:hypothetical protein